MIARSSDSSSSLGLARRQASEQYLTCSHERSHFFRHVISRPQAVQGLVGSGGTGRVRWGERSGCGAVKTYAWLRSSDPRRNARVSKRRVR